MNEWNALRVGLGVVGALVVAAVVAWLVREATYEDPTFERIVTCLRHERGLTLTTTADPIARSAELGATRTVVETNGVTVSVGDAERLRAAYLSISPGLGPRLERRGKAVYLWDRDPSPTQRQALFSCTPLPFGA